MMVGGAGPKDIQVRSELLVPVVQSNVYFTVHTFDVRLKLFNKNFVFNCAVAFYVIIHRLGREWQQGTACSSQSCVCKNVLYLNLLQCVYYAGMTKHPEGPYQCMVDFVPDPLQGPGDFHEHANRFDCEVGVQRGGIWSATRAAMSVSS